MNTLKLTTLAAGLVLITSSAFAQTAKTESTRTIGTDMPNATVPGPDRSNLPATAQDPATANMTGAERKDMQMQKRDQTMMEKRDAKAAKRAAATAPTSGMSGTEGTTAVPSPSSAANAVPMMDEQKKKSMYSGK